MQSFLHVEPISLFVVRRTIELSDLNSRNNYVGLIEHSFAFTFLQK